MHQCMWPFAAVAAGSNDSRLTNAKFGALQGEGRLGPASSIAHSRVSVALCESVHISWTPFSQCNLSPWMLTISFKFRAYFPFLHRWPVTMSGTHTGHFLTIAPYPPCAGHAAARAGLAGRVERCCDGVCAAAGAAATAVVGRALCHRRAGLPARQRAVLRRRRPLQCRPGAHPGCASHRNCSLSLLWCQSTSQGLLAWASELSIVAPRAHAAKK